MTENDFNPDGDSEKSRFSLRLPGYDYSQTGAYYVTICVNEHRCIFGDILGETIQLNAAGLIVRQYWLELQRAFTHLAVDEFVVMPNHIHGIVILMGTPSLPDPKDPDVHATLGDIIQWFKTMTTNAYIRAVRSENWPAFDRRLWQRGYYEHIIRNDIDLQRVREYFVNNPMKWSVDKYNPARLKN